MDRTSREYRNHPVRAIIIRAASGWAPPDEDELAGLHVPPETRDRVRELASKLYDVARTGGLRGQAHASTLAEDHTAQIVGSIPQSYRHAIRHQPDDDFDGSAAAEAVIARRSNRDFGPAHSESIDQKIGVVTRRRHGRR